MKTFWNNNSPKQHMAEMLHTLVPLMGPVPDARNNKALERYRRAGACYYDLYNNGLCNRAREFSRVFGVRVGDYIEKRGRNGGITEYDIDALGRAVEPIMELIVQQAYIEQLERQLVRARLALTAAIPFIGYEADDTEKIKIEAVRVRDQIAI